ncbi:MAG: hypothetical protein DMG70_01260 [Acidobacteria bacterium]|nr:MAG: hypothetical protein DMG70_01260 [Acidobacteriota bacterium]
MLSGGAANVSRSFAEISNEGGVGDPRTASSEKGQRFFDAIVGQLARLVNDLETGKIDDFISVGG